MPTTQQNKFYGNMAKYDYFISYSNKDKGIAFKILDAIESTGHICWIAPRNIPYGMAYARAIMEGIDECNTFMVLITDNSIISEDVLNEVDNAHAAKKTIIPIKLTDTQLPRELNYYLSRTQWLTLDSKKPHEIVDFLHLEDIRAIRTDGIKQNEIIREKDPAKNEEGTSSQKKISTHARKVNKRLCVSNVKSLSKNKLFGSLLIIFSLLWVAISFAKRSPNDNLLVISFAVAAFLLVLTAFALIKSSNLGWSSKKECCIFMGLPALFIFISSIAYTEINVKSDANANTIMDSSNLQDLTNDSLSISEQSSMRQRLGEEAFNRQDYSEAVRYFREMSDLGDSYGQYMLGKCYYSGLGVAKDFKTAFELYSQAAKTKMPVAINGKGVCYLKGRGTKQDFNKAAECFREAAEEGLPIAQANLADCYVYGNGVEQNYAIAKDWYEKAANQGYAPAAFNVGRLYYNGRPGIGLNYKKAAHWYKIAATLGLPEAQNSIGVCYLKGQGVERDPDMAFTWFDKAAMQGNSAALYNLANCYRDGHGVQKDMDKAKELYKEAADKGSTAALTAMKNI